MKRLLAVAALCLVFSGISSCNGSNWSIGVDIRYMECFRCNRTYSSRFARCPYCSDFRIDWPLSFCFPGCNENHHHRHHH